MTGKYDITTTHMRDIYGKLLWIEPLDQENRLYQIGERHSHVFHDKGGKMMPEAFYVIERVALAENIQHVNLKLIEENVIVTEPHL